MGGFDTPDSRPAGFLLSLATSFFGSFEGTALGDAAFMGDVAFDNDCLPVAVALAGVRGADVAVFCGLVSDTSGAVDGADAAAGWVSIGAGGATLGFGSGAGFTACASFALSFVALAIGALACAVVGWDGADFIGWASFGFPLTGPVIWALVCGLEGCDVAAAAVDFDGFDVPAFFASFSSNGEPFSIEPKPGVSSARAAPPETAPSSFGSAGRMPAVSSSAVETGLSGFAFVAAPVGASSLLAGLDLASE